LKHEAHSGSVALVFDTGEAPSPAVEADPASLAQTHPASGRDRRAWRASG
jgi:hypothetical protein